MYQSEHAWQPLEAMAQQTGWHALWTWGTKGEMEKMPTGRDRAE